MKQGRKRIFLAGLLLLLVCGLLLGCQKQETPPEDQTVQVSAEALLRGLLEQGIGNYGEPCCYGDEGYDERFSFSYHAELSLISDGALVYGEGVCADEITILRPASQAAATALNEALQTHIKEQIAVFEGYSPADVAKLKNALLYRDGGFVILLVSDNPARLRSEISALLADPAKLPVLPPKDPASSGALDPSSGAAPSGQPSEKSSESSGGDPSQSSGAASAEASSGTVEPPSDRLVWEYPTAVKAGAPVGNDYFADAIFLGDSRLDDLIEYIGPKIAADYTYTSLSVSAVFTKNLVNGSTIASAIRSGGSFSKCYLMFGFNELGWISTDVFIRDYEKVVELIRQVNPDCRIYIMNQYPVTGKHSDQSIAEGSSLNENNDRIRQYNELLADMAQRLGLQFINSCEPIVDEHGLLAESDTTDGCHADVAACKRLWEYLKTHTGN